MLVKDLKFRIVKKKNSRGTYANCSNDKCNCNTPFIWGSEAQSRLSEYELQNCEVELFTGMKDFDGGKDLYVGDIVEWGCKELGFSKEVGVIVWDNDNGNGDFRYGVKVYKRNTNERTDFFNLKDMNNHCRIIGNIHENAELLGGEE